MRVFLTSIPKAGTNMVVQAIGLPAKLINLGLNVKNDEHPVDLVFNQIKNFEDFGWGHIPFHLSYYSQLNNDRVIFLHRDLRDCMVSQLHWVRRVEDVGGGFINFMTDSGKRLAKCDDPITEMINRYDWHVRRFLPWRDQSNVLIITYEDLIQRRELTLVKIINHMDENLRVRVNCTDVEKMRRRINPDTCATFRKGIIGDWKNHFSDEHEELFWEKCGKVMKDLGYSRE